MLVKLFLQGFLRKDGNYYKIAPAWLTMVSNDCLELLEFYKKSETHIEFNNLEDLP